MLYFELNFDLHDIIFLDAQKHVFNDSNSLFQAFHNNGYLTSMFGKLTNDMTKYFCKDNPPHVEGFDRIQAPCDYNDFYGLQYFDKYENGSYVLYNATFNELAYETTHIGNATMNWLKSDDVIQSNKPLFGMCFLSFKFCE